MKILAVKDQYGRVVHIVMRNIASMQSLEGRVFINMNNGQEFYLDLPIGTVLSSVLMSDK